MAAPRRHIIRPPSLSTPANQPSQRQIQKLRTRLDRERSALARWQTRLKRAFNTVEKHQKCIARLERQLVRLEK
jgi:septal ring factor EnvC (AmiA/AmiB activator)